MAVTAKNAVFWDVTPCGSCKNRAFLRSVRRLIVIANVTSSPILATLMMEALLTTEPSVLTRATRRTVPEDDILHSHDSPKHVQSLRAVRRVTACGPQLTITRFEFRVM
jgi:hypothetical protein